MMGIVPAKDEHKSRTKQSKPLTHGHCYTEQSTDYPIHIVVDLLVAGLCTIHSPIRLFAHAQAEQVRFADNEVQVLIIDLTDAFRCTSLCCLRCKILQ